MKEDLMFSHLGNGVTIWDRRREEHPDYLTVAHISENREVTYYDTNLSVEAKNEIEGFALEGNMPVSFTQNYPVLRPILFSAKKVEELKERFTKITKDDIQIVIMHNPEKVIVFATEEACKLLSGYHRYTNNEVKEGLYHWLFIIHE